MLLELIFTVLLHNITNARTHDVLTPCRDVDVSLNLVTYHLIFAITGLVFCCLNAAINIVFYFVQSKVKHNNVNYCFSEDDISDDAWKLVDLDIFVCCRTFCCLF